MSEGTGGSNRVPSPANTRTSVRFVPITPERRRGHRSNSSGTNGRRARAPNPWLDNLSNPQAVAVYPPLRTAEEHEEAMHEHLRSLFGAPFEPEPMPAANTLPTDGTPLDTIAAGIMNDLVQPAGTRNPYLLPPQDINDEIIFLTEHVNAVQRQFHETMNATRPIRNRESTGNRPRTTRAERQRYHIDKEESEVVLAKFWDIIKVCDDACPSIRATPAETSSGLLIPDNDQKFSEETSLKLSQLTQYAETDMRVDKTQIALTAANAIGSMTVLYEALGPLLKQKKGLKDQLDIAMVSLNKIVTAESVPNKRYHEYSFEEGMSAADKVQVSNMLKETNMFKGYLRQWWNRIYDTVAQLMGLQHDTRQQLENADFRL